MQDQLTQQEKKPKWSAQIKGDTLIIQYFQTHCYQGLLKQTPYFNLNVIKDIVDKGQAQILSKTSTKIKIRIMTVINLQLHNQDYLEMQKLKARVQQLQEQLKQSTKWQEEDLNSTESFNINYNYKFTTSNNYSIICFYVDQNYLYHQHNNGSVYNVNKNNRKSSSTGHVITKMWKQKVQ